MNNKLISCGILLGILCTINIMYAGDNKQPVQKLSSLTLRYVNKNNPVNIDDKIVLPTYTMEIPTEENDPIKLRNNDSQKVNYEISSKNDIDLQTIKGWMAHPDHLVYVELSKGDNHKNNLLLKITEAQYASSEKKSKLQPNPFSASTTKKPQNITDKTDDTQSFQLTWPRIGIGVVFIGICVAALFAFLKK